MTRKKKKKEFKKKSTDPKKHRLFGIGKDRNIVMENLSLLIGSGMGIISAIDAAIDEVRTNAMKDILRDIKYDIEAGSPVWRAFERSNIFPRHTISLVKFGGQSGSLAENIKIAAYEYEKSRILRSKIFSATMYPVFLFFLTFFIGTVIAWFILPKLAKVFSQLSLELPLVTSLLIDFGVFLGKYGYYVIPLFFVVLFVLLYFLFSNPKTKVFGYTLLSIFPGSKILVKQIELSRFGFLMSTLVKSGLQVTESLDSLSEATIFPQYRKLYKYLSKGISDGNTFHASFNNYSKSNKLVPSSIQQMIAAGEQSGNLVLIFGKIGDSFEEKSEMTTKNLTILMEPVLLFIVWVGVVAVALAVVLPIYNLIGSMN